MCFNLIEHTCSKSYQRVFGFRCGLYYSDYRIHVVYLLCVHYFKNIKISFQAYNNTYWNYDSTRTTKNY